MSFELPTLPYATNALEPFIDAETMEIHHGKHHNAYVTNLNKALEATPQFLTTSIEELLMNLSDVPETARTAVRNNGGGHANHSMFWKIMKVNNGEKPTGDLGKAITTSFGSYEDFTTKFAEAGTKQFGSGWVFLCADPKTGELEIVARPNQDSPLMEKKQAVLGNDVWEHAYYLKYRNKRPDYLAAWWNVVNWTAVAERYQTIMSGGIAR
jgi:superoxide dismutase, Fe-Mn family